MKDYHQYYDFIRYAINPSNEAIPNVNGLNWRLSEHGVRPPFNILMGTVPIAYSGTFTIHASRINSSNFSLYIKQIIENSAKY